MVTVKFKLVLSCRLIQILGVFGRHFRKKWNVRNPSKDKIILNYFPYVI